MDNSIEPVEKKPKHTDICRCCGEEFESTCNAAQFNCWDCLGVYGRQRVRNFWKKYRLTPQQVEAQFAKQKGKCWCCEMELILFSNEFNHPRNANIDHCHDTMIFRGLLCSPCNKGIGLLGDTVEGLQRAIEYLERTNGQV